ncbi:hypothetical protein ACFX15_019825 [Malus domestica]
MGMGNWELYASSISVYADVNSAVKYAIRWDKEAVKIEFEKNGPALLKTVDIPISGVGMGWGWGSCSESGIFVFLEFKGLGFFLLCLVISWSLSYFTE